MTYTISIDGQLKVSKYKRQSKKAFFIASSIMIIGLFFIWLTKNREFDIYLTLLIILFGLLFIFFNFFRPFKRAMAMLENILTEIDIVGVNCSLRFYDNQVLDSKAVDLEISRIEILPANMIESNYFKEESFIVFSNFGRRSYFVDSFWNESALILDQLEIER